MMYLTQVAGNGWTDDLPVARGHERINDVIDARVRIDDVTGAPSPVTN
jgi:hypothetical protein